MAGLAATQREATNFHTDNSTDHSTAFYARAGQQQWESGDTFCLPAKKCLPFLKIRAYEVHPSVHH